MKRIGIVGVGLPGTAVASRLLEGGFDVAGYDTMPAQLVPLRARGLVAAAGLAEAAANADAIFTILPSPDTVEAAFLGRGGPLPAAPRRATAVPMSPISPPRTRRLARA